MKKLLIILLLAGTATSVGAATVFARIAANSARERDVAEANLTALRDTVTMYEDSVTRTVSLMQEQGTVNEDSIAGLLTSLGFAIDGRAQALRALNSVRVEFNAYRTSVESVEVVEAPEVVDEPEPEEGSQQARFDLEGPPIQGSLFVTYRPTPPWGLRTDLTVTPFTQHYTVGCQETVAVVNITTPPWVNATPERGTISPDVCNPVKPQPIFSISVGKSIWAVAGGVFGWILHDLLTSSSSPSYDSYDRIY